MSIREENGRRKQGEKFWEGLMALATTVVSIALVLIFVFVAKEALPVFLPAQDPRARLPALFLPQRSSQADLSWEFAWQPVAEEPRFCLVPLLVGTFKVALIAVVVAGPLGLGAAILASELMPPRWARWLETCAHLLAGIPTIIWGFFALMFLADYLQSALHLVTRLSALTAGLALGMAVTPTVFFWALRSLAALPANLRVAALSLGLSRGQVVYRVILPAAWPALLGAVLAALGRATGETMIAVMAAGNAPVISLHPADPARTMAATIAAELAQAVFGGKHYSVLFFMGLLLFTFSALTHWGAVALTGAVRWRSSREERRWWL
ncbi:MAG: ABC transporter permease subunit [Bacillota bacterium]|nr:ABC transporter permease subunit [Bacillota bacterium]